MSVPLSPYFLSHDWIFDVATCDVFNGDLDHFFDKFSSREKFSNDELITAFTDDDISHWTKAIKDTKDKENMLKALDGLLLEVILKFNLRRDRDTLLPRRSTRKKVTSDYRDNFITDETDFYDLPDLAVLGTHQDYSPTLQNQSEISHAEWRQVIVPITIYTAEEVAAAGEVVRRTQLGIFAKQLMVQQPHRKFFVTLEVSNDEARVYVFHRAGMHQLQPINIHSEPQRFLRLLLCLCYPYDDSLLGIDKDVFFDGPTRKLRFPSFTPSLNPTWTAFTMVHPEPMFQSKSLQGRGTCCWRVRKETGDRTSLFIVKDAWRHKLRESEIGFLKVAKGLRGVSQMINFAEGQTILDIPGVSKLPKEDNRIFSRTILEDHGEPLMKFRNGMQLLQAFYDAIAGHRELWKRGILHSDISLHNIIIGKPSCKEGFRGVLIDFDLAQWIRKNKTLPEAKRAGGTRQYHSIRILESLSQISDSRKLAHTYLDDLESFVWALVDITHNFLGPGSESPTTDLLWMQLGSPTSSESIQNAFTSKKKFLEKASRPDVKPYFGHVFEKLLDNLCSFIRLRYSAGYSPPTIDTLWSEILPRSMNDYEEVLLYFERAIEELHNEDLDADSTPGELSDHSSPLRISAIERDVLTDDATLFTSIEPGYGSEYLFKANEDIDSVHSGVTRPPSPSPEPNGSIRSTLYTRNPSLGNRNLKRRRSEDASEDILSNKRGKTCE